MASGRCRPVTTGRPGLMMPAFSAATFARVSPRYAVCSNPISVRTATKGVTTLVLSSRPPSPVSRTATWTFCSRNHFKATAVVSSKNVPGRPPGSAAWTWSARSASSSRRLRSSSGMGAPEIRIRSLKRIRCGLV